jgi:hypothetical protein
MKPIVDEIFRRGRFVTQFVAAACLLTLVNACTGSDQSPTEPRALLEPSTPPVLDLEPLGLGPAFNSYSFLPFTPDVQGANDYSGQNDVNQMTRADNGGLFGVAWTWDEVDAWTGTGQTGDVCALFDTDATTTGNADYALCVRISNPGGNPNVIAQTAESPILYECSDKKTDRCTTTVIPRPLGNTFCEVVKTTTDAFPNVGADGADVLAACGIDLTAIGTPASVKFLNVCSFPSGSPNSNPFDCILVAGSGYLKIVKQTTPDNSSKTFSFLLKSGTSDPGVTHTVIDDELGDDESALIALDPSKTYSLEETNLPTGWALGNATCTGSTLTVGKDGNKLTNIKTTVGGTVTCTFENAQNGSITIEKDALPNNGQVFSYTVTGAGLSAFDLDDDGDETNTFKKSKQFTSLAAGKRTIAETAVTGWKVTNVVCTGQTSSVVKYGAAGVYTHNSWVDGDNAVEIDLVAGENVSCKFENTKLGSITITKDAVPDNSQPFSFTTTGLADATFNLDDDPSNDGLLNSKPFNNLLPGVRTVTEDGESGWTLTFIVCSGNTASTVKIGSDSDWDVGDTSVEIDLKNGESVNCTFTNTKHGSITIVKNAVPDHSQEFSYTTTNLTPSTFTLVDDGITPSLKSRQFSTLLPGTYVVAEDGESGWALTNINCGAAASATIGATSVSIALTAGENVTCTFQNTQGGSITIVKDSRPEHGQDFAFTATGAGVEDFSLDDDGTNSNPLSDTKVFSGLQPGVRTFTEGDVAGWTITGISCPGANAVIGASGGFTAGDKSASVDLTAGQNVTCTFVNTKNPTLTVVKDADPTSIPETGAEVTYTVTVTNTTGTLVNFNTFTDDGVALNGVGTCVKPATLAANGAGASYSCTFKRNLPPAAPGATHTNTVAASISNDAGSANASDPATVTYTDVLPQISVSKNATVLTNTFVGVLGTLPSSFLSGLTEARTFTSPPTPPDPNDPNFASSTCDDKGANDINSSQVDLNCFNRADNLTGRIFVRWTWDGTDDWGGGGSTGDGCALLDTDGNGKSDVAICARITNENGGIVQVGGVGHADVYTCNNTKPERCAGPTVVPSIDQTTCTIQPNVPNGFPAGDDGADTQATCDIDLTMPGVTIPATTTLLNVCSFPSGEPNSNPFDCVVTVGSGFLQIVKATNVSTSTLFGFKLSTTAAGSATTNYAVQGGITSALIPLVPLSGNTKFKLVEELPTDHWTFLSASCRTGTGAPFTANITNGFDNIAIESGKTTVCTFTNTGEVTGSVTYTVTVRNTGTVDATVFFLEDNIFGNLLGFPSTECPTSGKTMIPNGTYECVFTRTVTGVPGSPHTNKVGAKAKDLQNNETALVEATKIVTIPSPP